jgi:MarR family multiple antibiotic resistance transcriptional regulator
MQWKYIPGNSSSPCAVVTDMRLFELLVRFETDFWNAIERQLSRAGLVSLATLQALRVLNRHEGAGRVHELSQELSISIGAASKLVDRLERDGLAVRRPHPEDRRSSLVGLTTAGQSARIRADEVAALFTARVLGASEDVGAFADTLQTLQNRLDHAIKELNS